MAEERLLALAWCYISHCDSANAVASLWIGSLPVYTERIEQSEKQRKIVTYTIQTSKGEIVVTELRSGTEFNRILQMPDGKVIAEAGWINRWAEEQIRMIGTATCDE